MEQIVVPIVAIAIIVGAVIYLNLIEGAVRVSHTESERIARQMTLNDKGGHTYQMCPPQLRQKLDSVIVSIQRDDGAVVNAEILKKEFRRSSDIQWLINNISYLFENHNRLYHRHGEDNDGQV